MQEVGATLSCNIMRHVNRGLIARVHGLGPQGEPGHQTAADCAGAWSGSVPLCWQQHTPLQYATAQIDMPKL